MEISPNPFLLKSFLKKLIVPQKKSVAFPGSCPNMKGSMKARDSVGPKLESSGKAIGVASLTKA